MQTKPDIEDLLDRWEDLRDAGKTVSVVDLCRDCPELADKLRREIRELERVNELLGTKAHMLNTATSAPPVPDRLGRYDLQEVIGQGGFGQVWRAYDPELERTVAVKVLRPELQHSQTQVDQFLAEARKVAKLRHPNIVRVYDVGQDGPFCYIVSDFVQGGSLASTLRGQAVPYHEAVRLVIKIAGALQHAHEHGIYHRDIKPHNIVLDEASNEPLVTDFGIAVSDVDLEAGILEVAGTPAYMSPEQASAEGSIDARTDIHSLGVVFYELLVGTLPYEAKTVSQLRDIARRDAVSPPSQANPEVPEAVDAVCLKALALEPSERWTTAREFADQLLAVLNPAIETVSRDRVESRRTIKPTTFTIPRRLLLGILVAIVVLFAVIGAVSRSGSLSRGGEIVTFTPGDQEITSCRLSPDGKRLIASNTSDSVFVWDLETRTVLHQLSHNTREVWCTDAEITTVGRLSDIKVWDISSGRLLRTLPFPGCLRDGMFSGDGALLLYANVALEPTLFDVSMQKDVWTLTHYKDDPPYAVAISADGSLAVVGGHRGIARVFAIPERRQIRAFNHNNYVQAVAISPNNQRLLTCSWDGHVRLFDLATKKMIRIHLSKMPNAAAFSQNGKRYAAGAEGMVFVWNSETGKEVARFPGHNGTGVRALSFSQDGTQVVSGGKGGSVTLWQIDPAPK